MSLPNFLLEHWIDIADVREITASRWNGLKNDIKTLFQGGVDRENTTSGGMIPGTVDGTALTLVDGSLAGNSGLQTVTRDTRWSGLFEVGGREVLSETIVSSPGASIAVGSSRVLVIGNTNATQTITQLTGGVAGQRIRIIFNPNGTFDTTLEHGTDADDFFLDAQIDFNFVGVAVQPFIIDFIRTDINGALTNQQWVELRRLSLAAPVG